MEGLLLLGAGAVAVAFSPLVPALRPAARAAVKGGLAVADAASGAVAVIAHYVPRKQSGVPAMQAIAIAPVPLAVEAAPALDMPDALGAVAPEGAGPDVAAKELRVPAITDVEGIGPKVASLLAEAGIESLEQLAQTDEERLRTILSEAGPRYRAMDPATWPRQAKQLLR